MDVFHIQNNMCFYMFLRVFPWPMERWLRAIAPMIMIMMMTWIGQKRDEPTQSTNACVCASFTLGLSLGFSALRILVFLKMLSTHTLICTARKTHKPTYASHHYISLRELTNNGRQRQRPWWWWWERWAKFSRKVNVTRANRSENIVCWLQTQSRDTSRYISVFTLPGDFFSCSFVVVGRPENLIRYFMRPNVSYDCLFRIFSSRLQRFYCTVFFAFWFVSVSSVHFQAISCSANSCYTHTSIYDDIWRPFHAGSIFHGSGLFCCWFDFYLNLDH